MSSHPPHSPFYPLAWNGIRSLIPKGWQPIVKGNSHLIFEHGLTPLLEIRWERSSGKISPENKIETLLHRMGKAQPEPAVLVAIPDFLAKTNCQYQQSCYGRVSQGKPEGAFIVCRECGTIILVHFFPDSPNHSEELSLFFQNLDCHRHRERALPWTIMDISFRLPDTFKLDRFSFAYGMSRIEFRNRTGSLVLCRLAPASRHLEQSSLSELFSAFSRTDPESHQVHDSCTITYSSRPGPGIRLLSNFRKKRAYTWSRFTHVPQADRILGISLTSSKPLVQEHIDSIRDSYAVIQD